MTTATCRKVGPNHLARQAYLYIRQAAPQVFDHQDSSQRQYALRAHARALGWSDEQIVVIDCDSGRSAVSTHDRQGFQALLEAISQRRVGLVVARDVSRLSRSYSDWHGLLALCSTTDTLILLEDGLFDPAGDGDLAMLNLRGAICSAVAAQAACGLNRKRHPRQGRTPAVVSHMAPQEAS